MKESILEIDNANGIGLTMHHAQQVITDADGTHPGDDEIILFVADVAEYDTDLIQNGNLSLHFTAPQARRFARRLWQMSRRLLTAQERADMGDTPRMAVPTNLLKEAGIL